MEEEEHLGFIKGIIPQLQRFRKKIEEPWETFNFLHLHISIMFTTVDCDFT